MSLQHLMKVEAYRTIVLVKSDDSGHSGSCETIYEETKETV